MSYHTNLSKKGFVDTPGDKEEGKDVTHFAAYFNVSIILNPFKSFTRDEKEVERIISRDAVSLNGSKELIQEIINLGSRGRTYNKEEFNNLLERYD